jgi:hypothetical protein
MEMSQNGQVESKDQQNIQETRLAKCDQLDSQNGVKKPLDVLAAQILVADPEMLMRMAHKLMARLASLKNSSKEGREARQDGALLNLELSVRSTTSENEASNLRIETQVSTRSRCSVNCII